MRGEVEQQARTRALPPSFALAPRKAFPVRSAHPRNSVLIQLPAVGTPPGVTRFYTIYQKAVVPCKGRAPLRCRRSTPQTALAEATGLNADQVLSAREVLPAVRYAVDAYLELVSRKTFVEAVASSLTEMFSRDLISLRMDKVREHYPWLSGGLDYFEGRLSQAPEDANFALAWVIRNAQTRIQQNLAIDALRAKCDILWAQLDAIYFAYVEPGWSAPGAFRPEHC